MLNIHKFFYVLYKFYYHRSLYVSQNRLGLGVSDLFLWIGGTDFLNR